MNYRNDNRIYLFISLSGDRFVANSIRYGGDYIDAIEVYRNMFPGSQPVAVFGCSLLEACLLSANFNSAFLSVAEVSSMRMNWLAGGVVNVSGSGMVSVCLDVTELGVSPTLNRTAHFFGYVVNSFYFELLKFMFHGRKSSGYQGFVGASNPTVGCIDPLVEHGKHQGIDYFSVGRSGGQSAPSV
jgi:hypothetical protein